MRTDKLSAYYQIDRAGEKALEGGDGGIYAARRERFFKFQDGACCRRAYDEILPPHSSAPCATQGADTARRLAS